MHVRATVEPSQLRVVPPSVVIVADMQGPVEVFDAVEQEPQGEPTSLYRVALVLHDQPKLVDLVRDAAML
jgi:hypothetical protein